MGARPEKLAAPMDAGGGGPSVPGRLLTALAVVLLAAAMSAGITYFEHRATLVILGTFVGVAVLWNPVIGFVALVASLPFETAGMLGDPSEAGSISVMKLAGLLTCAGLVLDFLCRRPRVDWGRMAHPLGVLVVLFAVAMIVSASVHPTEESFREAVRFVTIMLFFFVTLYVVNSPARMRLALTAWVAVGGVVALYSLLQWRYGATVGSEEWEPVAGTVIDVSEEQVGVMRRAAGPFTHPVWLALYLSVTMPLTLVRCWTARHPAARAGWAAVTVLQAAAILATYSRMGYLAMVLGVALLVVRRRGGTLLVALLASAVLLTTPAWPDDIKARVLSIFDYTKSSSSITRIGQQLAGWWMFQDHWVAGVGPGNFADTVARYADRVSDTLRIESIDAHNLYVQVLAELGLQGLVLIVLLLVLGWRAAERARRRAADPVQKLMFEAMSTSLVVFAASAVLIHATYQKEWWMLLALVAAGDRLTARAAAAKAEAPAVGRAT